MAAGGLTQTGVIGFVGGIELPPIVLGYEGWVNGAVAVRPEIDTRISYLNNFDDAAAGHEAALALIRLGADMLHHNADAAGLGVFQATKESPGVFIFGANADQSALAPDRVIGSAAIDLPRAFLMVAGDVAAGTFEPDVQSFGLGSGVISYRPNPSATRALPSGLGEWMDAARDSIITGTLSPLTVPASETP
jgi:basic membrane lipoprotein Med (substrate-binding protein (PBP1-ABC) superfamily)